MQTKYPWNGAALGWNAFAGFVYQVQYKNTLTDTNWINLLGRQGAPTNQSMLSLDAAAATNISRFYRLVPVP